MSRVETYLSAFSSEAAAGQVVERIEIPLIQRDYAQGRETPKVNEIRATFLGVLHRAIAGDDPQPVSLDFVYGEIDNGTLQPLDGQQRLTTLFLLHWYIAARAGELDSTAAWTKFSYATRQSARRFCERLVRAVPPSDVSSVGEWVRDQSWFLFVWRHDPTIEAMLVMLNAIHARFRDVEPALAWRRLTDLEHPVISFHLLPLPDMGSADDLYIKMNSRGKPLTDFENFKAHFEKTIESSPRAEEFAQKIDVEWSDLLWSYRGLDDNIDDEFLRYLEFVTELCEWLDPNLVSWAGRSTMSRRAERVFGEGNPLRDQHLELLFSAFDVWVARDVETTFQGLFASTPLFFRNGTTNLFAACCASYGDTRGQTRSFSFGQTLVLFAVVLHLIHGSEDFSRRVRTLRNLIEGSQFEMRADRMSRLVALTRDLVLHGTIPLVGLNFSLPQIDDEMAKAEFRAKYPECSGLLDKLEDHPYLRGSLNAFPLDAESLAVRADGFRGIIEHRDLWSQVSAALLTVGDYQRPRGRDLANPRSYQLAAVAAEHAYVWRALLTGATRAELGVTARVFAEFLDIVSAATTPLADTLDEMTATWLAAREEQEVFDWRYYMVKYSAMREGESGLYFTEGGVMGYSLCNLRGGKEQMNSLYRDPYLLSIYRDLSAPAQIEDPWFVGYEWDPRYLVLGDTGLGVRCTPEGFVVRGPGDEDGPSYELHPVRMAERDGLLVDAEDRIRVGARLVTEILQHS